MRVGIKCSPAGLALVFLLLPLTLFGGNREGKSLRGGALFYLESDSDREPDEPYKAGVKGSLDALPYEAWSFRLQVDAGTDAVRLDELWGRYRLDKERRLRFGIFENGILMEDVHEAGAYFAEDSYLRTHLKTMGWYSRNSVGGRYSRRGEGLERNFEFFFISSSSEVMMRGELSIPLGAGRLGGSLVYYPHLFHNMWGEPAGSNSSSKTFSVGIPTQRGVYEIHYFLLDIYWGDLTGETGLVYKTEVTGGNNLSDPAGVLAYGGDDDSCSFFLGGDFLLGWKLGGDKLSWTPLLNVSALMDNLEEPELGSVTLRAGNRWVWKERLSLFLDAGVKLSNYYRQEETERTLMTGLDGSLNLRGEYRF